MGWFTCRKEQLAGYEYLVIMIWSDVRTIRYVGGFVAEGRLEKGGGIKRVLENAKN